MRGLFADITSISADPRSIDRLYVTMRHRYDPASRRAYPGGLYASRDAGRTWKQILDFRFVQTFTVSPVDSGVLYAGTNDHPYHDAYAPAGVLKSIDGGATWERQNTGLSHHSIHCLCVSPHDHRCSTSVRVAMEHFLVRTPKFAEKNHLVPVRSQRRFISCFCGLQNK